MLNVAFLWHFHQPSYWDPIRRIESMPWVRLHSIKGYSDMAAALEKHPGTKANVNIVPALLERWAELSTNGFDDEYFRIASLPANSLKVEDKEFLLSHFFQANWDTMINPYPRYHQLLVKRGYRLTPGKLSNAASVFTVPDLRDLQVWFNLSWFGFWAVDQFKELRELRSRDRGFSEKDKKTIWDIQKKVIDQLIPRYQRLWDRGQVEITTSPYYHPILPLLIDSQVARESLPKEPMPSERFQAPEDAKTQLEKALTSVERLLGKRPVGLWPSEGSVSMESLQMASEAGFQWAATDEAILFRTIQKPRTGDRLYQPYQLKVNPPISMVFRDRGLSDAIGFQYSRIPAKKAADEFLGYLRQIGKDAEKRKSDVLVSVILDGENPWEYFSDGGQEFLDQLYRGLEASKALQTVRMSDFLADNPPKERLTTLFPGSWINANFRVWIGDKEKNRAWDLLTQARRVLTEAGKTNGADAKKRNQAWEALYRAEGSDWFWWFGDLYSSDNDAEFDRLFRNNLREIYQLLQRDIPPALDRPISRMPGAECRVQPAFTMTPVLDGRVTSYYEWIGACKFDVDRAGGTMSLPDAHVHRIYYGFDVDDLYLRVDFRKDKISDLDMVQICFDSTPNTMLSFAKNPKGQGIFASQDAGKKWQDKGPCGDVAWVDIFEARIPLNCLGVRHGQEMGLYLLALQKGKILERWPLDGVIQFVVPTQEQLSSNWYV
jgi:alpha-amylase/alpha-mannosidase (GH57 family)